MSHPAPRRLVGVAILIAIAFGAVQLAIAASSSPPSAPRSSSSAPEVQKGQKSWQDLYEEGLELSKAEDYQGARKLFEQAEVMQPKSPEVLNMLAYTQRKTGDLDQALVNYHKALEIKPKFPQAREYLGEAYLQAAMREAETLKGYGDDGVSQVQQLANAFQEAASRLENKAAKGTANVKW